MIDPFCGTGSVGVAAAMLGGFAVLSDVDKATFRNVRFHLQRLLALPEFAPTTGLLCVGEQESKENLPDAEGPASQPANEEEEEEEAAFGGDDDDFVPVGGKAKAAVKHRELGVGPTTTPAKKSDAAPVASRSTPAAGQPASSSSSGSSSSSSSCSSSSSSSSGPSSANDAALQQTQLPPIASEQNEAVEELDGLELDDLSVGEDDDYAAPSLLSVPFTQPGQGTAVAPSDEDEEEVASSQLPTQPLGSQVRGR